VGTDDVVGAGAASRAMQVEDVRDYSQQITDIDLHEQLGTFFSDGVFCKFVCKK
jgi:hypothetical protein